MSSPSSPSGGDDDRILTYGDATVLRSDLSILSSPHFLNDRLIHFYFTHISDENHNILLIAPSISFFISHFPDPYLISPLNLTKKEYILFPVNNNDDVSGAEGGSHWSLLVCCMKEKKFVHHDSLNGINGVCAVKLFRNLKDFVGGGSEWRYLEGPTPQQTNGYDCGLFVLAIAKLICKWYSNNNENNNNNKERLWFDELMEEVNGNKVRELRAELRDLILELVEKKNNSGISQKEE